MSLLEEFDFFMNNVNKLTFSELIVISKKYNIDCNNKNMKEVIELIKNYISRNYPDYIDYYILREQKKYITLNNKQRNQLFLFQIEQQMRPIEQERVSEQQMRPVEQERIRQQRIEQERVRQQQIEQERVRQQQIEQERVRQQQIEQERVRQQQIEQEEEKNVLNQVTLLLTNMCNYKNIIYVE